MLNNKVQEAEENIQKMASVLEEPFLVFLPDTYSRIVVKKLNTGIVSFELGTEYRRGHREVDCFAEMGFYSTVFEKKPEVVAAVLRQVCKMCHRLNSGDTGALSRIKEGPLEVLGALDCGDSISPTTSFRLAEWFTRNGNERILRTSGTDEITKFTINGRTRKQFGAVPKSWTPVVLAAFLTTFDRFPTVHEAYRYEEESRRKTEPDRREDYRQ